MKLFKSSDEREATARARAEYDKFLAVLDTGTPEQVRTAASALTSSGASADLSARDRRKLGEQAFRSYADTALADEVLTEEEEQAFYAVCDAVGMGGDDGDDTDLGWTSDRNLVFRMVIAQANDGRLNTISNPKVIAKKGEVVHLEVTAALMKEVTMREFRGGSSGFSFRITKGVRYRTGSFRGHSVVVGTQLQVADTGVLSVTSTRVVFLGSRKTIEIPFSKLAGVEVFTDGIRLSASNRQNAPLFRLESGDVVGATLNAAVQRASD